MKAFPDISSLPPISSCHSLRVRIRCYSSLAPAMHKLAESASTPAARPLASLPVSAIVAVRNEERNLAGCLESLREIGDVYVVDSQSTDATVEIARSFGAKVVQFHYQGGWPKKRQWAMESLPLAHDWILLLDADKSLTPELAREIQAA